MNLAVELTIEQLARSLKRLTPQQLAELEMYMDSEELLRRSEEVKAGEFLPLEDLSSLSDV